MSDSEQQLIAAVQKAKRLWHSRGADSTEFHNALMQVFRLADEPETPPTLGISVSDDVNFSERLG